MGKFSGKKLTFIRLGEHTFCAIALNSSNEIHCMLVEMHLSAFKSPRCNNLTLPLIRLPRSSCNRFSYKQYLNDEMKTQNLCAKLRVSKRNSPASKFWVLKPWERLAVPAFWTGRGKKPNFSQRVHIFPREEHELFLSPAASNACMRKYFILKTVFRPVNIKRTWNARALLHVLLSETHNKECEFCRLLLCFSRLYSLSRRHLMIT